MIANERKPLVVGWFSFELMGATAGDVISKNALCAWLRRHGIEHDVAMWDAAGANEVRTAEVLPARYSKVVFVCGPIGDGPPLNTFLERFPHAAKFAVNVTLLQTREQWNPFLLALERDSSVTVNPDITFLAPPAVVPVVGLILVGPQKEYRKQRHDIAEQVFTQVLEQRDLAVIPIDTRLDVNRYGLRSAAQIESAIARMDAVLTTRLHGAAISLRRGVPPVVIDPLPGGAKVLAQMRRIGWPLVFHTGDIDQSRIDQALEFALTDEARRRALDCALRAREEAAGLEKDFMRIFLQTQEAAV
jgi:hypothetical protein